MRPADAEKTVIAAKVPARTTRATAMQTRMNQGSAEFHDPIRPSKALSRSAAGALSWTVLQKVWASDAADKPRDATTYNSRSRTKY